jgi:hypothetical protein
VRPATQGLDFSGTIEGAPFWFDLLKKAINIRSVGLTPDEIQQQKGKRRVEGGAGEGVVS